MTKKIFYSILTVALAVLLASMGIAISFLYNYFNIYQTNQLKAELMLVAQTVNDVGEEYFESFDSTLFRFTVVDEDGTVLYDTEADVAKMDNHLDREEISEALKNGRGSSTRTSTTQTEKTYYEAVRLENGDVLRISVSRLTVGALLLAMLPAICAIVLVAAILSAVLSHGMAKKITQPLMKLDLDNPQDNDTYEELSPILAKLRNQHGQIKSQMEAISRKNEEFQQIVSSMNEGLVLIDELGMVLSMNVAAKKFFDVKKDVRGSDFLLVDSGGKISKAVWSALEGEGCEYTEQRNECEYRFTVSSIKSDQKVIGALILVCDISDKAFAQRNRREFTANITHELKTPLQSIIGSAELLENGLVKPEDRDKFVGNIRGEATRLVSLINDIIRLSQLDEDQSPPTETVELCEVSREVEGVLRRWAEKRNVTIEVKGEKSEIFGVRKYIYDIIYNLCDNAIRYNVDGGSVVIEIGEEKGQTFLSVKDTGIGIAPEHRERIFERFYRVDKSHSRETGGTGLGLSIVKHAVLYHGAKIDLDSELGGGTEIKITF